MIKKLQILFWCLISCITLYSCNNDTPGDAAKKFLTLVSRADLDGAKKYCDSNTVELLNQANYLRMIPDSIKEEGKNLQIKIKDEKINGNNAVVTYTTSKLPDEQIISLVKINNKWLVQLSKMQQEDDIPMFLESNDNSITESNTDSSSNDIDSNVVSSEIKDTSKHQ